MTGGPAAATATDVDVDDGVEVELAEGPVVDPVRP